MSENRRQILDMVSAGKITAEEAERLLDALGADGSASEGTPGGTGAPKYMRVVVDAQNEHEGPVKVNVRVPMQLLRAGVRLTSLIPPRARDHVNEALREKGLDVDINQIKPENLEEIVDQLKDLTVDVDSDDAKVRVFCE